MAKTADSLAVEAESNTALVQARIDRLRLR